MVWDLGTTFLKESHFSFIFRQLRTIFHLSYKISTCQHFDTEGSVWAKVIDLRDSGCIRIPSLRSRSPLYHTLPVWHFWDGSLYQTQPAWQGSLGAQRKCTSSHDENHQRNLSIKYRQGLVSTQNSTPGEITLRWFMECGSLVVLHFAMPTKTTIMYNWFHLDLSESIKNFVYT